jgi:hypothetical protein
VREVTVAWKLRTIEEWYQDRSCSVRRLQRLPTTKKNCPWFKSDFCVAQRLHTVEDWSQSKVFVSTRMLQEQRPPPQKFVPLLSPGEDDSAVQKRSTIKNRAKTSVIGL